MIYRHPHWQMVNKLAGANWMRMATGTGTKGIREYDWAWHDIDADYTPTGHEPGTSVLVMRRHRYTCEVSYFRCHSHGDVSLAELVEVICRRWRIEECFQFAKSFTGLDQGQVTCWNSWMRWSLFSLIAATVLALTHTATMKAGSPRPARLIPLTCPELLRLLRALVLPQPARDRDHVLYWSAWRRRHQHVAATGHRRRHLNHDTVPC